MYRLMQPSDRAEILALWQRERGDGETFVTNAIERFAGVENVYVAEENDAIAAVALAVPVTLQGRQGSYLYGLCGQGSLILAGLLDYLCAQQKLRGAGFTVAVPAGQEQAALLENKGFQRAFALRCLPREVSRNLWSQAEFDSVTARKLGELRARFWPDTVQLPPEQMVALHDVVGRDAQVCKDPVGLSAEGQSLQKHDEALVGELLQTDTFPLCQGVVLMNSQLEDVPKQQGGFKYLPINARGGDRQIDLTPVEQRSDLLVFCDPLIPLVVGVLVHEGVHPLKKLRGGDRQGNGVVPLIGNVLELPL